MSRFSVFIRQHFGTDPSQTATDIIMKYLGDSTLLGSAREIIMDAVAVMEGTGLTGEQKKLLVTAAVNLALKAAHINIPASLVSYLIEEAVLLLKGGQPSSTPAPAPAPQPDPTAARYATEAEAQTHVTAACPLVLQYADGTFGVWPVLGPLPGTQVYPKQ